MSAQSLENRGNVAVSDLQMNKDIYEIYGDFLSGQKLDVGRRFYDLSRPTIVERIDYLRRRCVGKRVLHIGCLDHPDLICERVDNGTWLHSIISNVSALCIGIDIDSSAYELVRTQLGIENVQLLDLSRSLQRKQLSYLREAQWDLILCPETLEHITNHQQFLQNLRNLSCSNTTLIVTVPNAFGIDNFLYTLRRFECINSDHKYWFTSYTLSRTLANHGWKPHQLIYYEYPQSKLWQHLIHRLATRLSRAFSNGLIIEATPSAEFLSESEGTLSSP
jgi:2-polyprenyl-3-methyl-5-hydroxy-6-metoxy-1,4-benzoquinol methylase